MTPCEKLGYKVGDRFIVKGAHAFGDGSVIELQADTSATCLLFNLVSGSCKYKHAKMNQAGAFCSLEFVQKIEEKEMTHQKEPHAHAEMIKAYADDVSLCVFVEFKSSGRWCKSSKPVFDDSYSYFLCLPKHKEACLHWLNGGEAQTDRGCGEFVDSYPLSDFDGKWYCDFWYMLDDYESRIKPRKETRHVVIHNGELVGELFKFDSDIRASYGAEYHELQIFKIEVEV